MTTPLRWGLLGTGSIAGSFTTDLRLTGSGRVAAVGSRTGPRAEAFAAANGIARAHGSYEALVSDPEVDVVYVATPHPMHRDCALAALEGGKPVLVEKPFAINAGEAREMASAAIERGLFCMEAMWTRFLPHVAEIRRLVDSGRLGELVSVSADHGQWFPPDRDSRLFAPELGGGALLDLGVYPLAFASMLLGEPDRIEAVIEPAFTGVDATTSVLLGHPSGAQASITCTLAAQTPTVAVVAGTEARIEIAGPFYRPTSFELVGRSGERERFEFPHEGIGLRHQADEVARCIAAGETESPLMPLAETISIAATMDAALEAGWAGRR